jgi:hypothetical protein
MMKTTEENLKSFIVEYTNEDLPGNQVLTMEIDASDLEEAYDIMEDLYPHLAVDNIYPNDSDRFFTEQPIEEVRMDEANRELRELAEEAHEEAHRVAYSEYIQAMLHSLYEDAFYHTEWDMV